MGRRIIVSLVLLLATSASIVYAVAPRQQEVGPNVVYLPLALQDPTPEPPTATPLPTATSIPPTATPAPTPAPTTLVVKSSSTYMSSTTRYVVGELYNGRSTPVFFAQVSAKFYDAQNQLVAVEDTYADLTKTDPKQLNPFKLLLSNAPTTIVRYELTTTFSTNSVLDYRNVLVTSQQVRNNYGPEVFGEVRNDYQREMRGVEVVVTFYDANGNVVETDFSYVSGSNIAAGATATYKITTFREFSYTSFQVQAQGYLAP